MSARPSSLYGAAGAALACFALGACALLADPATLDPTQGMQFEIRHPQGRPLQYEQVWQAALAATAQGRQIVEAHKPSGSIRARVGPQKVVGFFIHPTLPQAASYRITLSTRVPLHNAGDRDWDPALLEDFKRRLGIQ